LKIKKLQNRFIYGGFEVLVVVTVIFWDVMIFALLGTLLEYEMETNFDQPAQPSHHPEDSSIQFQL
jgi:hypothetical protein